ncbi:hypothetical protein BS17DRAFT_812536 [Gyrodon lividus]|nr:hypothetical protein BS17DRAFT_812536 [Gyrodon lividus]
MEIYLGELTWNSSDLPPSIISTHSQSNDEIARLQQEEEERVWESAWRIQEARVKKARREAEKREEARWTLEEEARKKAEEDERRRKAEAEVARVTAERLWQGSQESQRHRVSSSLKGSEAGPSQGGGAMSGPEDRAIPGVREEARAGQRVAAEVALPHGGKDRKRRRQKSLEAWEESEEEGEEDEEDKEDKERQDALRALSESYEAQRRANEAYQGAVVAQLSGMWQVLSDGLAAFLVSRGSQFGESREGWGALEWKGKERDDSQGGQGTDGEDGDEEEDEGEEGGEEDGDGEVV